MQLILIIVFLVLLQLLRLTYYRKGTSWQALEDQSRPLPIGLKWYDFILAFICWMDSFVRTYAKRPGLYYTGKQYDSSTPILVTSNYHLTIFSILWHIRKLGSFRLLIIDTDGINVWCAAGKGQFSNQQILAVLKRYKHDVLTGQGKITLILPKLSFSGVILQDLKKEKINPIIGPIYAKDLPTFLSVLPYKDQDSDCVDFNLATRVFTCLPGLLQVLTIHLKLLLVFMLLNKTLAVEIPFGLVSIPLIIATLYPLLFPFIPGTQFASKGVWLGAFISAGLVALFGLGYISNSQLLFSIFYTLAASIFFGLSYTGNSAISNYSKVKKEVVRFFPVEVLFYTLCLVTLIYKEVWL